LGREGLRRGQDGERGKSHQHDQGQRAAALLAQIDPMNARRNTISGMEGVHWLIPQEAKVALIRKAPYFRKVPQVSEVFLSKTLPTTSVNYSLTIINVSTHRCEQTSQA
jgi:hypothetical protein